MNTRAKSGAATVSEVSWCARRNSIPRPLRQLLHALLYLLHLTAMDGRSRTSMCFAAPAPPCAMAGMQKDCRNNPCHVVVVRSHIDRFNNSTRTVTCDACRIRKPDVTRCFSGSPNATVAQIWHTWPSAIYLQAMHRTSSKVSRFNAGFQVPVHGIDSGPEVWIIERMAGY